jgi:hypothetical protein
MNSYKKSLKSLGEIEDACLEIEGSHSIFHLHYFGRNPEAGKRQRKSDRHSRVPDLAAAWRVTTLLRRSLTS